MIVQQIMQGVTYNIIEGKCVRTPTKERNVNTRLQGSQATTEVVYCHLKIDRGQFKKKKYTINTKATTKTAKSYS